MQSHIHSLAPPHLHRVIPYAGGLGEWWNWPHENVSEVVNDINGELMNFYNILASEEYFGQFSRAVSMLPFSEPLFISSKAYLEVSDGHNKIARAVAFFVKYRQSRQGIGKCFATLSKNRLRRGMNEQVSSWLTAVEGLPEAHDRLKRAVVKNVDAPLLINQEDGPNTFYYLDPPYLDATRVAKDVYEYEMDVPAHQRLLETLSGIKGKFLLSGYDNPLYDSFKVLCNWRRVDVPIDNKASSKDIKDIKIESFWMNYE